MDERVRVNQKRWDALAQRHGQGDDTFYDVGGSSCQGAPSQQGWQWYCAPLADWDGQPPPLR